MGSHGEQINNNSRLHSPPKAHLLHRPHLRPRFRTRQFPNPRTLQFKPSLFRRLPFKRSIQIVGQSLAVTRSFSWGVASGKVRTYSSNLVTALRPSGQNWSIRTTLRAHFHHLILPDVSLSPSIGKRAIDVIYQSIGMSFFLHMRAPIKDCQFQATYGSVWC